MMSARPFLIVSSAIVIALVLPLVSRAQDDFSNTDPGTPSGYYLPEDVLLQAQMNGTAPIRARNAEAYYQAQQARRTIYTSSSSSAAASSEESSIDAGTAGETTSEPADPNAIELTPADIRLLLRLREGQTVAAGSDGTLHTGAPLAPSGPEGTITVVVMLLAIAVTVIRAEVMGRKREM